LRVFQLGVLLVALVTARPVVGQQRGLEAAQQYVRTEMQRQHIPGMSVGILRDGRVLLKQSYGYANLELHVPAGDSTVYQSGSLGKQFTAALVAMLAEQGRLDLNDTIVKWFPEGDRVWRGVTVRQLLTHTSGVAEYTDSTFDYRRDYTEDQLVRFAASRPLDFPPGDHWAYSNTGYLLLGVLIHRLTGRFYGDLLQSLIFAPLKMATTRIISESDIVFNRAAGYRLVKGHVRNQDWVAPSLNTTADGSLYLSINDLMRWASSLDQRRIPDARVLELAWAPVRLNDGGRYPYGFGWDLMPQRGHPRIGHTGSWQGFKTAIYRYPEYRLTVIALANLAEADPGAIAEGIAGLLEPALLPAHRLTSALSGGTPPQPAGHLLGRLLQHTDSSVITPGLQRFLSPDERDELRQRLDSLGPLRFLGCDDLTGRGLVWLSSPLAQGCYSAANGAHERAVFSLYYTGEWRLAFFDVSRYPE
jgi:CubicO group peptidase (beta-lactamase class C family)